ncbi:MAG: SpoIIE family protein phosphatase [Candidatus Acidoferrales bacterium]
MAVRTVPRLVLIEPSGARRELALARTPLTLGRHPDSDVVLGESRISRRHARIRRKNGHYLVEDCHSRCGTYVNGEPVKRPRELHNNDRIEFGIPGSYVVVFVSEEENLHALLERVDTPTHPEATSQKLRKLSLLLEVGRSLHGALGLDDVLTVVLDASLSVTNAERGFILLRTEQGQLEFRLGRHRRQRTLPREDFDLNHPAVRGAVQSGGEILIGPPPLACLPLRRPRSLNLSASTVADPRRDLLGVLCLESRALAPPLSTTDRQVLHSLADDAASVLENHRLLTATRLRERIHEELSVARSIQQTLLPQGVQQYDFFRVASLGLPCYEVGGDYYDVIELSDRRVAFVIADVCGKGIPAAMLSSSVQGALVTGLRAGLPLTEVARHLNEYLCQNTQPNNFATLFCGLLHPDGRFQYVNAGHLPALWQTAEGIELLSAQNVPVGLFPGLHYAEGETRLHPNHLLVLYSDGVVEASDARGESYGLERLKSVVRECRCLCPERTAECILQDVRQFSRSAALEDDVSLMVVRYQGNP